MIIFRKTKVAANVFFLYAPFMKMRLSRSTERDNREMRNILSAEYGESAAEAILNRQAKKPLHECAATFYFLPYPGAESLPDGGFPPAGNGDARPAAHPYLAGGQQLYCFQIDHIGAVRLHKAAVCQ